MKMMTATKSFKFTHPDGRRDEVLKGERIVADHELVTMHPDCWRTFTLDDELRVRSDRVAELREAAARPAGRAPVSEAGREEARQADFWRSTTRLLESTHDDGRTSAERREQAHFDQALASLEDSTAAELADINAEALRAYGFDRGWSRRVAD